VKSCCISRCLRYLIPVAIALLAGAATAETYRWRDAEGVHFSDTPPPGVAAETVRVKPQPSPLTPDAAKAEVERLREAQDRERDAAAAQQSQSSRAEQAKIDQRIARLQRCEEAKWALSALESGRPVYRDEQNRYRIKRPPGQGDAYTGKREYLDDPAREREIAVQKQHISAQCDVPPTASDKARTAEEILHAELCEKAAADLAVLTRPESGASAEDIAARRAFLAGNCGD